MRKPQPKTLPVTRIPFSHREVEIQVFFFDAEGAHFSLHAVPEPGSGTGGGPILVACDGEEEVHSHLLDEAQVRPGARLAYLVHELGGPDHVPKGTVVLLLDGPGCDHANGLIIIDIPRDQVALGYIEFVEWDHDED